MRRKDKSFLGHGVKKKQQKKPLLSCPICFPWEKVDLDSESNRTHNQHVTTYQPGTFTINIYVNQKTFYYIKPLKFDDLFIAVADINIDICNLKCEAMI